MAIKHTPASVETKLKSRIEGFHERAHATKSAFYAQRDEVFKNDRLTADAKKEDVLKEVKKTNEKLLSIREEQDAFISGYQSEIERAVLGSQPSDAESVMLRRDAAARARKIADEAEAIEVIKDATRLGDSGLAHAAGYRARQKGWVDALDAYREAQPAGADNAVALATIESLTSDAGYILTNSMAYSPVAF